MRWTDRLAIESRAVESRAIESRAVDRNTVDGNQQQFLASEVGRLELNYSPAYQRLQDKIAREECIILDGGIATEFQRQHVRNFRLSDSNHWGFEVLERTPQVVADVHRSYVRAGCDVVTTNTYAVLEAPTRIGDPLRRHTRPVHWMDMVRKAILLARDAIDGENIDGEKLGGENRECAVAFSIGGDVLTREQLGTVQLLLKIFAEVKPDFVLFETLSMMSENLTRAAIELVLGSGIPVWASFRRCRDGVCGAHGQLWGGPEGDYFGRLAQDLEALGVDGVLINCLPIEKVSGTLPWLRDFTNLYLGAYPNVGRYLDPKWKFDETVTPEDFAELGLIWRAEGAQILGGCCGVGPDHIEALARGLKGTKPFAAIGETGQSRESTIPQRGTQLYQGAEVVETEAWIDERGRDLYPLPLPDLACDPEVFVPTQGSYLLWKYLYQTGVGADKRCLDVGCGAGILAVQLALNGAQRVTAVDVQKAAVANTLTNAFRNGVADRVQGEVVDLYAMDAMDPGSKYDLVVASLYQMPTDPHGELGGHRPVDYWGRNLLDHLIVLLPRLLEDDGVAYLMQISLLSQVQTAQILHQAGLEARVIDFNLHNFGPVFLENMKQIERVEDCSDAHHFQFRDEHVMAMYLLEVRRQRDA
ncbi:homocysteine S-methyltransferase family protein [Pirellulales bacterium]|nr:homocysteine S-methyltransferase family protein [Pirellulales bacterium]